MVDKPVVVEAINLTKKYGEATAVNLLNLQVRQGEVFGFLGPNGAGKTTTILMFLGLTEPNSGSARVCGHDPVKDGLKVRRTTGYLPENVGFYEDMSGRENLVYTARLNGISYNKAKGKIDDLLSMVGLSDRANDKVEKYSKGMK
ncbi:MAG: ABC transporter ATP-binding protein, partial [Dehalococcoidia bacterium]|nr:ABC transporter ATP-binding protein [Dehalococcoidia bacterium]